jgi:hypothetical protein
MSNYLSTLRFGCSFENDSKTKFIQSLENIIFILKFLESEGFEGFGYEKGNEQSISELTIRLREIVKLVEAENIPENFLSNLSEYFENLPSENNDWGGGLIDLEENNIEFNESICVNGLSMHIFCSFNCRSKMLRESINKANADQGGTIDLSDIEINDYDEEYIDMSWYKE